MEAYMAEVVAEYHMQKSQLISYWFSSCLLLWQRKQVGYSYNSPICPLALNMAKLAKRGWSYSAMEKSQYQIKKPCAKAQEEKMWGVESPAQSKLKAVTGRHPVMVPNNQVDRSLYCQNVTVQNLQARWRCKEMGAPPPQCLWQLTPLLRQLLPGNPPAATGVTEGVPLFQIKCIPPRYLCIQTLLPNTVFFNLHVYAENHKWENDVIPDIVTNEATSTGWSTLCCLVK
jgi:hypothetical protein